MNLEALFIATAAAQGESPSPATGAASQGGLFGFFMPLVLVFGIFYLLLIRPQQKQRKKHQEMVKNLKKGDEVVTSSGIHGRIFGIADAVVTLEVADNVRIKIDRPQVAQVKTGAA